MPRFAKSPVPVEKKTRTRRPLVVMLAVGYGTVYDATLTPWHDQVFPTVDSALAAASTDPEYCQGNPVHAITVSPRIVPKVYQPRKPVMVFDAPPVPAPAAPFIGLSNGPSPEGSDSD